jgi:4-alpha-glucanotransferase
VDYERVRALKTPLLVEAAQNFLGQASGTDRKRFDTFCREHAWWLDDFVLFSVLRQRFHQQSWNLWPGEFAHRDPAALDRVWQESRFELDTARVLQFAFFEQWRALRAHCKHHGIRILGDVAIFVNYDSADVWNHPGIFRLDADFNPEVVAGVPPDAFSETGQYWGNPLYRWDVLQQRGYEWWIQRIRCATETCDLVRLDHFRGFEACWEIPAHEKTAIHGRWVKGPADSLFEAIRRELGILPFIAEDLGVITPEVNALRERLDIPGMRVMQFGFGDPGARIYLPHRFESNAVVYTGTHDNDTTLGWWRSGATPEERRHAGALLGADDHNAPWAFMRGALGSIARYAIVPLQDVLELGSEARMNTPSRLAGNWGWRFAPGATRPELAEALAQLVEVSDRDSARSAGRKQNYREAREEFSA